MKKLWRKIILSFLTLCFLFFGPFLILHSMGFKIDFEKKRLVKTGVIFLTTSPKEAKVFLNEKFVGKTHPIFGSFKIAQLLPRKYKIKIKKENYFDWEKEVEVKEGEVKFFEKILLFPKELKFEKTNLTFKKDEEIKPCPETISFLPPEDCFFLDFEPKIILDKKKNVFVSESGNENFTLQFENVKKIVKSNDEKKLAILKDGEIWILERNGKKNFLLRESQEIKDLSFFGKDHLVYLVNEKIKLVELDFASKMNIYEIVLPEVPERVSSKGRKILLLIKNEVFASPPLY